MQKVSWRWTLALFAAALICYIVQWRNGYEFFLVLGLVCVIINVWVNEKENIADLIIQKWAAEQRDFIIQRCGADRALADRIIQAGRLNLAEARVGLYQQERRHMCLKPCCRKPVVGESIFAHCADHLSGYEKNWLQNIQHLGSEERFIELEGAIPKEEPLDHRLVAALDNVERESFKRLIGEHCADHGKALGDANRFIKSFYLEKAERNAILPAQLKRRMEETAEQEEEAVGWSLSNVD